MDEKKELVNVYAQQSSIRFFDVAHRHFNLKPYPISSQCDLIPQLKSSKVHHLIIDGDQWANCDMVTLLEALAASQITSLAFDWMVFKNKIPNEIKKIFAVFQVFCIKKLAIINISGEIPDITLKLCLMLGYLQQSKVRYFIWEGKKDTSLNPFNTPNFLYPWEKIPSNLRYLKITNLNIHQASAMYLSSLFKGLSLAKIYKLDLSYSLTEEIDLSLMFNLIGDMPLKFLYLKGNKLEIKSLASIHKLKNLEYLDLENNALNTHSLVDVRLFFSSIKKSRLKFLGLRKNKLAEIKLNTLSQAFEELNFSTVTYLDLSNNGFFSSPNYPLSEVEFLTNILPENIRHIIFHEAELPAINDHSVNAKQMKKEAWLRHFPDPTQIILSKHNKIINPFCARNRAIYAAKGISAPTFVQLISFSIVHNSKSFTLNDLVQLPEEVKVKIQESKELMNAISFVNRL